ncbi:hypothetical protein ACFJIX_17965 [Roseateles sp. UC29_93]|uniref:hypothetical protein n=1 Tax=Roseateles sp. UC29_93 TaxID=3350177 RepID=UPI00366C97F9
MFPAATIPTSLNAGDTLSASLGDSLFSADEGWGATLRVIGGGQNLGVAGTANGDGWEFTVPAATTAGWAVGSYSLVAVFTKGAERQSSPLGVLSLKPDPAAGGTTALDLRTPARQALDALQKAYLDHVSGGSALLQSYTVGTRSFTFQSVADLIGAIEQLKREVRSEELAAGNGLGGRVLVRM